ncbi:protein tyrosine phosphatase family protein [Croceibacterium sp. LX-88]|uniref:Protein tyrosine phosphatase family protein n=1 Tax=Croceibacterium selenioxidans TaxID=2838833 RepID=A0ABS5W4V4_9SPHN|nr:protein tyrosine phosphatase family protein [Croceibacterium selenioxidans]MBT2134785.1 protein tyrosine phosphatase family protein [Croceibacterium selenioxidans]
MRDLDDIRAWQRLSDRITTSGRLQAPDPARLAEIGVRHVINLALADHPEALPDAEAAFAAAGLGYTHIPVPFDAPTEVHYQAFLDTLETAEGPVHVHCIMNWRVSAFFYRYHRDACGIAEPEARALMERQWSPEDNDHPAAPAWAAFIRERHT